MFRTITVFLFTILLVAPYAWAEQHAFDIGGGLHYYSGVKDKSLAPNTAVAARFGAQKGDEIFRWSTAFYALSSSGESYFDDAGTSTKLNYKLIAGEFNIGFHIYPLGFINKLPLQPFMGAAGTIHIPSVSFDKDATTSKEFPKSDAPMMFGYSLFVGTDLAFAKDWGLKIHVEQTNVTGTLAKTPFSMGGQRVIVGLYFN